MRIPIGAPPSIVLFAAATAAIIIANSPMAVGHEALLSSNVSIGLGPATSEMR